MLKYYPSINLVISDKSTGFPKSSEEFNNTDAIVDEQQILELEEWQTYYLKFYSEPLDKSIEEIFKEKCFEKSDNFIQNKIGDIFIINFQNYVGLSRIGPVKIEISNRKINKKQYQSLLSFITEQYTDLVYQFSRTKDRFTQGDRSHTGFSTKREKTGRNLDYVNLLFLKQKLLDSSSGTQSTLNDIVNLILKEPHYKIQRDLIHTPIEQAGYIGPNELMNAISNGNNLIKLNKNNQLANSCLAIKLQGYFPVSIQQDRKYHSFNTAENRFIKYFFEDLLRWLGILKKRLSITEKTYFNPEIEDDINALCLPIRSCLEDPLWQEVSAMRFIPTNSQVLQRKEGYRQLLSLYSLMQLASQYDFGSFDFKNLVESKDTNILYEYWCFFMIKDILDELLGQAVQADCLVNENNESMSQEVTEGTSLYYKDDIHLGFNVTYRKESESYSQEYRPDFVIQNKEKKLILDAKHKLQGWDDDYSKPKKEDIDKMHTYKDAIIGAVGAFILYPGENDKLYRFHDAKYDYEGVGGISLVPDEHKGKAQNNMKLKQLISEFIEFSDV